MYLFDLKRYKLLIFYVIEFGYFDFIGIRLIQCF